WRKNGCLGPDPVGKSCDCYVTAIALYFNDEDFLYPVLPTGEISFQQSCPFVKLADDQFEYWNKIGWKRASLSSFVIPRQLWKPETKNKILKALAVHLEAQREEIKK